MCGLLIAKVQDPSSCPYPHASKAPSDLPGGVISAEPRHVYREGPVKIANGRVVIKVDHAQLVVARWKSQHDQHKPTTWGDAG